MRQRGVAVEPEPRQHSVGLFVHDWHIRELFRRREGSARIDDPHVEVESARHRGQRLPDMHSAYDEQLNVRCLDGAEQQPSLMLDEAAAAHAQPLLKRIARDLTLMHEPLRAARDVGHEDRGAVRSELGVESGENVKFHRRSLPRSGGCVPSFACRWRRSGVVRCESRADIGEGAFGIPQRQASKRGMRRNK